MRVSPFFLDFSVLVDVCSVKWHIVTLQEAAEYVDHAILHERFYVTHFAGGAVLFNKDTFYSKRRCQVHLPP